MALHIFIDANIFLNFYDFNDEDLKQLKKLVNLIDRGGILLYVTKQLKDEVERHRDSKVSNSFKRFKDSRCNLEMPVICKTYQEYEVIKRLQEALDKNKTELANKLWADIENRTLKADEIISALFGAGKFIDSDPFISKARVRHVKGNPPGKKDNSYGDEINWETLIKEVPDNTDFVIISKDGDYQSALNPDEINSFLKNEWASIKKSKIYYFKNLTTFFSKYKITIKLRFEEEKNNLIHSLGNSGTFAHTHEIIERLSKFSSFTDDQIVGIGIAALENSQVGSIITDPDIEEFYARVLSGKASLFELETWVALKDLSAVIV